MPKITPSALIQSMSGKVCAHSDTYFATNKQTGRVYAVKVCNPNSDQPNEAQLATRAAFAKRSALVKQWFATNRPSDSQPKGTAEYQEVRTRFKAQHSIGSMSGFVSKYIQTDGTVGKAAGVISGGSTPSDGTTTPPASGGTTNPGTGSGSSSGGSSSNLE